MQTPFDVAGRDKGQVTSREKPDARSVFPNFKSPNKSKSPVPLHPPECHEGGRAGSPLPAGEVATLQSAIDLALARALIYRLLAHAFEYPSEPGWSSMASTHSRQALDSTVAMLRLPALEEAAPAFTTRLTPDAFECFTADYIAAFGHAARGLCPMNEIEYGDLKADALFQPHRLADLAAFYRAFGLEISPDATERHDHICLELEFMSVLAAKEAFALEQQLDEEDFALCCDAQKKFLREHLGRWTPAFSRRLTRLVTESSVLHALANFTRAFVEAECSRIGVAAGSEDLLLRPVNEASESLCASCGITNLPPGALHATV
jgi:putative dimethyl sulfoxide reductase chaperone